MDASDDEVAALPWRVPSKARCFASVCSRNSAIRLAIVSLGLILLPLGALLGKLDESRLASRLCSVAGRPPRQRKLPRVSLEQCRDCSAAGIHASQFGRILDEHYALIIVNLCHHIALVRDTHTVVPCGYTN